MIQNENENGDAEDKDPGVFLGHFWRWDVHFHWVFHLSISKENELPIYFEFRFELNWKKYMVIDYIFFLYALSLFNLCCMLCSEIERRCGRKRGGWITRYTNDPIQTQTQVGTFPDFGESTRVEHRKYTDVSIKHRSFSVIGGTGTNRGYCPVEIHGISFFSKLI